MIVTHSPSGEIASVYFDPVAVDLQGLLEVNGTLFLNVPPTPVYDGTFDSDGKPNIQEYISASADHDLHYIHEGAVTSRPTLDLPEDIQTTVGSEIALTGIPASPGDPCMILIDENVYHVEDANLTLDADMPAEYSILIEKFPYQRKTIKVTVNGTA
ncbi:hypothetical protein IB276_32880 [Ensifer sp. ENS04]|uniref:hypothetical protein n=1 Tax=Ensifer sp. ENS04 TaxID=2769281 RepID=UPI00177E9B69|nr:hypothetical protein [Ensifer sp. ENS04]MBD9544241.1 hypothetical protein [Ensifer sp. ENS04]